MDQYINTYAVRFTSDDDADGFVADYESAFIGNVRCFNRYTHIMHIDPEIMESDARVAGYVDAVRGVLEHGVVVSVHEAVEVASYTLG